MGIRTAQLLSYPMINDYISLGSGDFIVEVTASPQYDHTTLADLLADELQRVQILLIKRKNTITHQPAGDFVLNAGDVVVLFGKLRDLRSIAPKLR